MCIVHHTNENLIEFLWLLLDPYFSACIFANQWKMLKIPFKIHIQWTFSILFVFHIDFEVQTTFPSYISTSTTSCSQCIHVQAAHLSLRPLFQINGITSNNMDVKAHIIWHFYGNFKIKSHFIKIKFNAFYSWSWFNEFTSISTQESLYETEALHIDSHCNL